MAHEPESLVRDVLLACELHDARRLAAALDAGLDVRLPIEGKTPLTWLLEMYTRSDRFPDCLRVLLARGVSVGDPLLTAVLLDDVAGIGAAVAVDRHAITARVTLPSAFTPLTDVTPLHVAAECGHLRAAEALLALGAAVDARAGRDADGLGGQTPLFHTVNSHGNRSLPVMRALLAAGADPAVRIDGVVWGRGLEWESTFFDLTPIAYAQLGLLPQMHREAADVDATVRALLAAAGRRVPAMPNVPNRYVEGRRDER